MSKLNVDEIESNSTNTNVKVTTQEAGSLQVKGASDDGTLQLNCSAQSHGVKLKAPNASQKYTMILPDNQIAAGKFLKVKSITGTGATAVGQLEFGDAPSSDLGDLNASNLSSGSIPAARYPTDLAGSTGAGLQLYNRTVVSSNVNQIDITGFDDDAVYKIMGDIKVTSSVGGVYVYLLNSSGSVTTAYLLTQYSGSSDTRYSTSAQSYFYFNTGQSSNFFGFNAELSTRGYGDGWLMLTGSNPRESNANKYEVNFSFRANYTSSSHRIGGIRFAPVSGNFTTNTEILVYKYVES